MIASIAKALEKKFYLTDFIFTRKFGQQTMVFNKEFIIRYRYRMKTIYGKEFYLEFNHENAIKAYQEYINNNQLNIKNIYIALGNAVLAGN